jgi:hypothetical protein
VTARSEVGIDLVARDLASQAIRQVGGSMREMGGAAQEAGKQHGLLGTIVDKVANGVFLGIGMMAVQKFTQTIMSVPSSVISMNASLETSTLQFETLFKDADRAKEHVAMLFEFAKKTPFETQPIIQASRTMQTFGGDALNTADNLTMIGNAAAGASTNINEVAFWVSRAYAAIQGGQPFGEARMRLQELALLSPQAAVEMERLQKAGASTGEVWAVLQGELGKFNGAMERQATTWGGLMSTLSDTFKLTLAQAFKPFFEYAKAGLSGLISLLDSPTFQQGIKTFADTAIAAFNFLIETFNEVRPALEDLWDSFMVVAGVVIDFAKVALPYVIAGLKTVASAIGVVVGVIKGIIDWAVKFKTGILIVAGVIAVTLIPTLVAWAVAQFAALAPWLLIGAAIVAVIAILVMVADVIGDVIGQIIAWADSMGILKPIIDAIGFAVNLIVGAIGAVIDAIKAVLVFFGILQDESKKTTEEVTRGVDIIAAQSETAAEVAGAKAASIPGKFGAELAAGAGTVKTGAETGIGDPMKAVTEAAKTKAVEVARATPGAIAQGLRDGRESVKTAGEFLKEAFKNAIAPSKEIAFIEGELAGKELKKALASQNPEIRAAGEAYKAALEDRLFALQNGVGAYAIKTGTNYADALAARKKEVADAAQVALLGARTIMRQEADMARDWGHNTGTAFGTSVAAGITASFPQVRISLAKMSAMLAAASPPGPDSPLHKIDVWGANTAQAWSDAVVGGISRTAAAIKSAMGPIALAMTPASPVALAATAGGGAAVQQIIHQEFHFGADSVRSDDDIRRIGVAMQERAQLQGFAATAREVGRAVG